jgi:hypothetical protein
MAAWSSAYRVRACPSYKPPLNSWRWRSPMPTCIRRRRPRRPSIVAWWRISRSSFFAWIWRAVASSSTGPCRPCSDGHPRPSWALALAGCPGAPGRLARNGYGPCLERGNHPGSGVPYAPLRCVGHPSIGPSRVLTRIGLERGERPSSRRHQQKKEPRPPPAMPHVLGASAPVCAAAHARRRSP